MVEIKEILFPCELGPNSVKILPYVLSVAEKYNANIHLLHVIEDFQKLGGFYVPHPSLELFQKEALKAAEKFMDNVCAEKLQGCPNFKRRIVSGEPSDEILKAIESEGIDLVIMGTHGRKGLGHTIFGSVAENVTKKSPVPVLVVNPFKIKHTS